MTSNAHGAWRTWSEAEIDEALRLHGPPHKLSWDAIGARIGRTATAVKNVVYKAHIAYRDQEQEAQRKRNRAADARFIAALTGTA